MVLLAKLTSAAIIIIIALIVEQEQVIFLLEPAVLDVEELPTVFNADKLTVNSVPYVL